ncbi:MAG: PaaX family transcriptional regulator [Actinomycetia bacterium]|nr:PaaX family transcriptional regulator [Actinomycetes bacterium]
MLGVRDKAARQALARMQSGGWLARERVGRQTRWALTSRSRELLGAGAEQIYGFGQNTPSWDGRWVVLLASVPERDRAVRYRMAQGLGWAGFGSIGQGIWLSPWAERERVAARLLGEIGVAATSFCAELGELGSALSLADRAWDLPMLLREYDEFWSETSGLVDVAFEGSAAVAALASVVHRWRRFPFLDPDLPGELLPSDWPGPAAAERFADLRGALLPTAREWWRATEAANTPTGWRP